MAAPARVGGLGTGRGAGGTGGGMASGSIKGAWMEPKFPTGDPAVVRFQDHYTVGDIVAYRIPKGGAGAGKMVIHRIIGHRHGGYLMQGCFATGTRAARSALKWLQAETDKRGERGL